MGSSILITLAAVVSFFARAPAAFPALGATAFIVAAMPNAPIARPYAVIAGNAISIAAGYAVYLLVGVHGNFLVGYAPLQIAGVFFGIAASGALMYAIKAVHPAATASALTVSMGLVTKPVDLAVMEGGVVIVVCAGLVLERLRKRV